jgi:hypothetical protein
MAGLRVDGVPHANALMSVRSQAELSPVSNGASCFSAGKGDCALAYAGSERA